jgi:hypothetical protein
MAFEAFDLSSRSIEPARERCLEPVGTLGR